MDPLNLYGVVLFGGNSRRMGANKSLLCYHGTEQRYHLFQLLKKYCARTFISYNSTQTFATGASCDSLVDDNRYAGNGPASGLLTAFSQFPSKQILLVGCDYPFLETGEISNFLSSIPPKATAAAFYNHQLGFYEPVLAWYSQLAGVLLEEYFPAGNSSLQEFLQEVNAYKYRPSNPASIRSIDTYEQYLQAANQLQANFS